MQEVFLVYKICKVNQFGGTGNIYEVSNRGNVKKNGELVIFNNIDENTYYRIGGFAVHRAVAELFLPNPEHKRCVDHINTDRHDNRVENLRWVTYKENNNNPLTIMHIKEALNTDDWKEQNSKRMKEYYSKQENIDAFSKRMKEWWSNEESRNEFLERRKESMNKQEVRQKLSDNAIEYWSNEENRVKQSKKILGRVCINNGIDEKRVDKSEVDSYLNNGWELGRKTFKWSEEAKNKRSKTFIPWNKGIKIHI